MPNEGLVPSAFRSPVTRLIPSAAQRLQPIAGATRRATMIRAKLAAGLVAFTVGAAAIGAPSPAAAAGSVSVTIAPKGQSANAVRDGLFLFSWAQQMRNYARVDQKGSGNGAAVSQSGHWNWATIFQRGRATPRPSRR